MLKELLKVKSHSQDVFSCILPLYRGILEVLEILVATVEVLKIPELLTDATI